MPRRVNMKPAVILAVYLAICYVTEGKRFERCEFYKYIKSGLDGYMGYSAANWVCLATHESGLNTMAINNNNGQSSDYGIFQINSKYWCNDYKTAKAVNGCGILCESLRDDNIANDIECAKKIAKQSGGLSAWVAWKKFCKGENLSKYTAGC
ncbi:lysozyme C-like [Hyperolius riggenbachi]|uniref:lysozyme C-like n=1 Tax=Hyperolius riggenbachi TaxID=752182 RepID=UPI0035A33A62